METPSHHWHRRSGDPIEHERLTRISMVPARYVAIRGAAAALGLTEGSVR